MAGCTGVSVRGRIPVSCEIWYSCAISDYDGPVTNYKINTNIFQYLKSKTKVTYTLPNDRSKDSQLTNAFHLSDILNWNEQQLEWMVRLVGSECRNPGFWTIFVSKYSHSKLSAGAFLFTSFATNQLRGPKIVLSNFVTFAINNQATSIW